MIAVTEAANTLVRATRSGETISPGSVSATVNTLVDALALVGHANQEINQRRRDDQKGDLNQAYKSLGKMDKFHPSLLCGVYLANRVKLLKSPEGGHVSRDSGGVWTEFWSNFRVSSRLAFQ